MAGGPPGAAGHEAWATDVGPRPSAGSWKQREALRERDVRLSIIGRRDRLPAAVRAAAAAAEVATADNHTLHLRLAIDYSARDAILEAARRLVPGDNTRADFARRLG